MNAPVRLLSEQRSVEMELVAAARRLQPMIQAASAQIEQEARIAQNILDALHAAGLFKMVLPRWLGGHEAGMDLVAEVVEILAQADASVAWCVCQGLGCSLTSAYLSREVAADVFKSDGVVAWGFGPQGKAIEVDGGHRVSGQWSFASGNRHADWLGGMSVVCNRDGVPLIEPDGQPTLHTFLFPRAAASVRGNWSVLGLRGTGSDGYSVENLFVPAGYSAAFPVGGLAEVRGRKEQGALYQFGGPAFYAAGFAALAIGVARGMLNEFIPMASSKQTVASATIMRDSPVIQLTMGQSQAKLESARSFLHASIRRSMASIEKQGAPTLDDRVAVRLAATHAISQAREVVGTTYNLMGATAIFSDQPFERRFRDMNTVAQHVQGHAAHFETAGQHLLGIAPNQRFL